MVACVKVPGFAQLSVDTGTAIISAGVDGLADLLSSENSSNTEQKIKTTETDSSGTSNTKTPSSVVNDTPKEDSIDDTPKTSNKGAQEHNNAGFQLTISQPLATTIVTLVIGLIFAIVLIVAAIIFLGKSRNVGSSFSLN